MTRPPRPGDPVDEFLTTGLMKKLLKGASQKAVRPPTTVDPDYTWVWGHSTNDIAIYQPVTITGPALSNLEGATDIDLNEYYTRPQCSVSSTLSQQNRWGVALQPIRSGQPGRVLLFGLTWLKADYTNLSYPWIDVSTGVAKTDESKGKAYVISPPGATGVGYGLCLLGIMPTAIETFITKIQVSSEGVVQYKQRQIYCHWAADETDWLDLPSRVCPEIPE